MAKRSDWVTIEVSSEDGPISTEALLRLRLDKAQRDRNEAIAEALKLETENTRMSIAIHTAIQEDRAPVWPPAASR